MLFHLRLDLPDILELQGIPIKKAILIYRNLQILYCMNRVLFCNITFVVQQDTQLLLWLNIYSQYVWQLDVFRTYRSIVRSIYKLRVAAGLVCEDCVARCVHTLCGCCNNIPHSRSTWHNPLCHTKQAVYEVVHHVRPLHQRVRFRCEFSCTINEHSTGKIKTDVLSNTGLHALWSARSISNQQCTALHSVGMNWKQHNSKLHLAALFYEVQKPQLAREIQTKPAGSILCLWFRRRGTTHPLPRTWWLNFGVQGQPYLGLYNGNS